MVMWYVLLGLLLGAISAVVLCIIQVNFLPRPTSRLLLLGEVSVFLLAGTIFFYAPFLLPDSAVAMAIAPRPGYYVGFCMGISLALPYCQQGVQFYIQRRPIPRCLERSFRQMQEEYQRISAIVAELEQRLGQRGLKSEAQHQTQTELNHFLNQQLSLLQRQEPLLQHCIVIVLERQRDLSLAAQGIPNDTYGSSTRTAVEIQALEEILNQAYQELDCRLASVRTNLRPFTIGAVHPRP